MHLTTILVAGSRDLLSDRQAKCRLAECLGKQILQTPGWRLVNGGSTGPSPGPWRSIDYHAAKGAEGALADPAAVAQRILTIHPRDRTSDLHSVGRVVRARANTTEARRFELVSRADAVVTIEGREGTSKIIEYAIAQDKPVIPIPCTGGASEKMWLPENYRDHLLARLRVDPASGEGRLLFEGLGTPDDLAKAVVAILRRLLRPRCLILMPFGLDHSDRLYRDCLLPWLQDEGLEPIRADEEHGSVLILDDVLWLIRESDLIVADVTGCNANVMYELGLAHAWGRPTVIICKARTPALLKRDLPFDIQGMRVIAFDAWGLSDLRKSLCAAVEAYRQQGWAVASSAHL